MPAPTAERAEFHADYRVLGVSVLWLKVIVLECLSKTFEYYKLKPPETMCALI
jgi:hypothetical protein